MEGSMARGTVVLAGSLAQRWGKGGHAWVFLQYLLGFRRLGWDVFFLDALEPEMCTDRDGRPCGVEVSANLRYLEEVMEGFGLGDRFALLYDGGSRVLGRSRKDVVALVEGAACLVNVMGFLEDEEILAAAPLRVFLDIDPGFGQMWRDLALADVFQGHDAHVTIGENLGQPECLIPDCGIEWITTPQPVVRSHWDAESWGLPRMEGSFSSVVSWRGPFAPIEHRGRVYGLRVHEFRDFLPLPRLTGERFELALEIDPADEADRSRLAGSGWTLLDPRVTAGDPWKYRDFIHRSAAEFLVAKNLYVDTRSGWISDRSLCYLASGRPVLAQDTGLSDRYPVGEGLLLFRDLDEAKAGVERIRRDYPLHARAARDLAAEYFDSDRVLGHLLARLGVA
jgi:hypothetical protein